MRKDLRKYLVLGAAPVAAVVGGGLFFKDWVLHAISANIAMNMKILLSMAVGAALMYWRLWQMLREDKALVFFVKTLKSEEGHDTEDPLVLRNKMRALLESKRFKHLDIKKVLEPVAKTGGHIRSRVDQAAIETEIHAMKEVMESRWEFPNFFVGFLVALGLLGTFIGLLETLVGTSELIGAFGGGGSMDEAISKLVTGLQRPLAGMGTAFAASMFGLVGSVVLGMVMMAVRACGSVLMGNVHHTVLQFTERSGPAGAAAGAVSENYLANAMADMLDVQREAQDTFNQSLQTSLAVAAKTEGVLTKLDALAQAVAAQTEATKKTNDLIHVGPRMRELAEQQLLEHKAIVAHTQAQSDSLDKVQQAIVSLEKRLAAQADGAAREREVLRGALSAITESQNATRAMLSSVLEDERDARTAHLREVQLLRQSTIDTNSSMAGWGTRLAHLQQLSADQLVLVERQATALEQMTGAIEALAKQMGAGVEQTSRDSQAARNANIDVAKQLSGLGTVLRVSNEQVLEHITKLAESNTQHSTMAGMVAQEIRVLKGSIGREVRKELREAVGQITGNTAHADE
jgi:hypothetical protein